MAFQIEIIRNGQKKVLKDGITLRPRAYETAEDAQAAADSHFALWRSDWKSQGKRAPTYRFVTVGA